MITLSGVKEEIKLQPSFIISLLAFLLTLKASHCGGDLVEHLSSFDHVFVQRFENTVQISCEITELVKTNFTQTLTDNPRFL